MLFKMFHFFATVPANCSNGFLGLKPWYEYLDIDPHTCDIKGGIQLFPDAASNKASDVPLILLAVADDLLRIAGIVAVAFVLLGAIKYITSQGDPEGTAKAQGTVINALLGLAIALVAVAFVSFLGNKLGA